MSTNQTEREVPADVEAAIDQFGRTCHAYGMNESPPHLIWSVGEEKKKLYHAILAALEPERELRARCERLRMKVIDTYADIYASIEFEEAEGLHPGDLADDLTATSSADEERAGGFRAARGISPRDPNDPETPEQQIRRMRDTE
jgi:hypothetical protein